MDSQNDDEVRSKPTPQQPAVPQRRRENEVISDYYDMLVIGRTGMGKSSTVDKLMVPQKPVLGSKAAKRELRDKQLIEALKADKQHIKEQIEAAMSRSVDEHRSNPQQEYEDLTAWVFCADDVQKERQENAYERLKNVVYARELDNSHEEVHTLRKLNNKLYASTNGCELLANDTSKVRVLDIPGFYSPEQFEGATDIDDSNLAIVRKIVRIQAVAGVRFRRVLYFLPGRGPLDRPDGIVQKDVRQMVRYFGKSIFRRMVLIATISEDLSDMKKLSREEKFKEERLVSTREHFQEAFLREIRDKDQDVSDLPQPPIIFIATTDTCEEILDAIVSAQVEEDTGLQLEFSPDVCIRCSVNIGKKDGDNEHIICGFDREWTEAIPYDESTCHPLMLPKYTARSIALGIIHLFLFQLCFSEEQCENCSKRPGTRGCMQIGKKYTCKKNSEEIVVDHCCELDEQRHKVKAPTK